ncbi:MAG: HAMP domain-containing protein [Chloroflexales bacterium]|nr:HAMP domain-containing protein [Chloroflexales bacterium]
MERKLTRAMTLRTKLTAYYTGFFAVALLLTGCTLYFVVRTMLERSVAEEMWAGMGQVEKIYNNNIPRGFDTRTGSIQLSAAPARAFVNSTLNVQVFSLDGELRGGSTNPGPQPELLTSVREMSHKEYDERVKLGTTWVRVLARPLALQFEDRSSPDNTPVTKVVGIVQISRPMTDIEETLRVLLYTLLGGGAVALILAAQGSAWLTRAALQPIDQVTNTVRQIVRAEDLGQRVPEPHTQDELQRLTITINDLLARLEVLFTAQRRFLADVSHELRTPLTAMHGNLEILARGAGRDPALLDESLVDMRRETSRLIRMVNDLLLLAQSESGIQLLQEPVELDTLLLEVHRELRPLTNGVNLRIGAEDQLTVVGDRDRLKQALLNLGINALQHTPPGGSVVLSLVREDERAQLSVSDTGEGIAASVLPHLFDRFYRADPARNHHRGGAGLGLAIVKWIVESHGGNVGVVSQPGQGSTFTITLPLQPLASSTRSSLALEPDTSI